MAERTTGEGTPAEGPMVPLEAQIRTWADATAAASVAGGTGAPGGPVTAAEAVELAAAGRARGTGPNRGRPDGRRLVAIAAAVLVLLGVGALVWTVAGDDGRRPSDQDVATEGSLPSDGGDEDGGTAVPPGEVGFRVLTVTESGLPDAPNPMGTLRAATDQASFDELWAAALGAGRRPLPVVDLDQEVVVSITIPDDACPPTLEGFDRNGTTLTPRFVEPLGGCNDPLIPKTFVVAIDWGTVGPSFTLHLPGQPTYGFEGTYLEVVRPPGAPDCASIEAFAVDLAQVQAGYDYQPTLSPDQLAERSDVVVDGRVAPGTTTVETALGRYAIYQVDHGHFLEGGTHPESGGGTLGIHVPTSEGAAQLPVGAEVVVFASWHGPFGGFVAAVEGFATACPGGPPIGAVGSMGEWSEIGSLAELVHAVG